jgi:alkanesulfonate monooxygenase SsuD/methylene tetrahydromethanopterin reductase-like flavin-dependent oxidoreductase (luciferase family)
MGQDTTTALKLGIYLNSQHPDSADGARCVAELLEQVRLARGLTFDSIWAGEHHLTPGYHFLPQLPLLARVAADAEGMALGTNLTLLPLHPPVDVAEQVALLDIMCGGRFVLTVGQGYRPEEFEAFGVPFEERLARMVEGIEIIRRLWAEDDVDHDGRWFRLRGARLRPKPLQQPGPPIWLGATTDRAIRRAGRIGDAFMATPNSPTEDIARQLALFHESRVGAGLAPAAEAGRMLEVHCHADGAEARRRAGPHLLTKYAAYASWGLTGDAGVGARAAGRGTAFDELARDRFVIGDPDEVTAGLVEQHRRLGVTHLAMRVAWPGSPQRDTLECLELLGRVVLPQVRSALGSA